MNTYVVWKFVCQAMHEALKIDVTRLVPGGAAGAPERGTSSSGVMSREPDHCSVGARAQCTGSWEAWG